MSGRPVIAAFDWVPDFARGQVRDLRVRWALEEVGQPYDVRYLSQGEQKAPPHRALQPYGQVPTYEEEGLTLFESGAIVLHIAETHGQLLPDGQGGRSRAMEWAFAALNTVEPPIGDHALATLFEADESWSKPRLPGIEERIRQRFAETAERLGDREWYDGEFSAGRPADDRGAADHARRPAARRAPPPRLVCRARRGAARVRTRAGRAAGGLHRHAAARQRRLARRARAEQDLMISRRAVAIGLASYLATTAALLVHAAAAGAAPFA